MALPKLFERIFWHNNTTPAINEDNLNAMSKAIDDIDDRVITLGDDVLTIVPQIQTYLAQADDLVDAMENLSKHPPYIGANGNWYVWDIPQNKFVDSGIDANITVHVQDVTMLDYGVAPYVTNTGTDTDPVLHLFIPKAATIDHVTKTGTLLLVDTYTITMEDGATHTFNVTNGRSITGIQKTNTQGNVDTYTISYNDNTTSTFEVRNGDGFGDMTQAVYDPNQAIANGGGITAYIENNYIDTQISTQQPEDGEILVFNEQDYAWKNTFPRNGVVKIYGGVQEGNGTTTSGSYAHSEGYFATASGDYSHAEGYRAIATGDKSHAEGSGTTASGEAAHAENMNTIASGSHSHAEGLHTQATGISSHAEGEECVANKIGAHAEGSFTYASANYAHAEGVETTAKGTAAHAEGSYSYAMGDSTHAEGYQTTASKIGTHAEGYQSNANTNYSHAMGIKGHTYTAFGVINAPDMDGKHHKEIMLGIGGATFDGMPTTLKDGNFNPELDDNKNCFSVDDRGNTFMKGAPYLVNGCIKGRLVADSDWIVLEDGAIYVLYTHTRLNTGAYRGQYAYMISACFNPADESAGTTTTAQALPTITNISGGGTVGAMLTRQAEPYLTAAGTTAYHSKLGIGCCQNTNRIRYTLVKVSGSNDDFGKDWNYV